MSWVMDGPRLGQHLSTSMRHELTLQPRMLQSIEALQLPMAELELWVRQAAEENTALRLDEPEPGAEGGLQPGRSRAARAEATERHDQMLRNQPERAKGLVDRVEEQLALLEVDEEVLAWVRFLVGQLDGAGFLSAEREELLARAREEGLAGGPEELENACAVLCTLEPAGIGARNAIEALVLQLDPADPDYALLRTLLEDFLEDVARNRLPRVARAMELELGELEQLIERLRGFNPRPAAELCDDAAPAITPDLCVEHAPAEGAPIGPGNLGSFQVRVENAGFPAVSLDEDAVALARDRAQPSDLREYLRERIDRARWIVEAVQQRRLTLQRVGASVFRHQRPFLEEGPGHLRPLRMTDVAEQLDLHVSTVSRAVAGKHVQTPWGIFPLRHFFQSSAGADDGAARSDVCAVVASVFAAEDPARPLSDDDVVRQMAQRGYKLARRTVTKYRQELGIPSSYRRRRF